MTLVPYDRDLPSTGTVDAVGSFMGPPAPPPPSPTFGETLGAAFRQDNIIGSTLSAIVPPDPLMKEDGYDTYADIRDTKYQPYADRFLNVFNRKAADALKAQIDMEEKDRRTLHDAGFLGDVLSMGATVADPTILLPGGAVLRGAKGGISALKTARSAALATAGQAVIQEGILQATQETRPLSQSAFAIGGSAILGGAIGGAVGKFMGREEFARIARMIESQDAGVAARGPLPVDINDAAARSVIADAKSAGAAAVPRETLDDLSIAGRGAGIVVKMTGWMRLNPIMRALDSPSAVHRAIMENMVENPIYLKKNLEGRASAQAVETLMKEITQGHVAQALEATRNEFKALREAGARISYREFKEMAGRAMRRGDEAAINPQAVLSGTAGAPAELAAGRVAKKWRDTVFDPLKDRAISLGLLPEDVHVTTADSYFTRLYNRAMIDSRLGEFRKIVTEWVSGEVDKAIRKLTASKDARTARIEQTIADLQLDGPARLAKIAELEKQAADLRAANADHVTRDSKVNQMRRQSAKAKDSGDVAKASQIEAEMKMLQDAGGEAFAGYLSQVKALRSRINLIRNNIVGKGEAIERARLRQADIEAQNVEQLYRLKASLEKMERDLDRADPELHAEKVADLKEQLLDVVERSEKAQDRIRLVEATRAAKESAKTLEAARAEVERTTAARAKIQQRLDAIKAEQSAIGYRDVVDPDTAALIDDIENRLKGVVRADERARLEAQRASIQETLDADKKARAKLNKAREAALTEAEKAERTALAEADKTLTEQRRTAQEALSQDARQQKALERAKAAEARRQERINRIGRRIDELEEIDPEAAVTEIRRLIEERIAESARLVERGGKRIAELAEKVKAGPDEIKALQERVKALEKRRTRIQDDWHQRTQVEMGEGYVDDIVDSIIAQVTGREAKSVPYNIVPTARGPLKERTFNIPDELIEPFLESDIEMVGRRYARVMASDIELTAKYGSADMKEPIRSVHEDYRRLAQAIEGDAELTPAVREKKLRELARREQRDIRDIEAVRDALRGQFMARENASGWGRIVHSVNQFNYIRVMGGVVLASLTDAARPMMVHGLMPYLRDGIGPLVSNLKAVKASQQELRLAGAATEREMMSRISEMADLTDPYSKANPVERWIDAASHIFSRMNGLTLWTDMMKGIAGTMTQTRILRNVSEGWERLAKPERDYLAFLGINRQMSERIAKQFREHGTRDGEIHIAGTEGWDDIDARRAFRAALNKDVDSIIVTPGVGDKPLFAYTPTGRALLQFKSFALAAHQRVMMRGMQESPYAFVNGLVAMSAIGMFITWMKAAESNRLDTLSDNPGFWIAEGLDRSGIFPLLFEASNTVEKWGGPGIKKAFQATFPGESQKGPGSRYISRSDVSTLLGPMADLGDTMIRVIRGIGDGDATEGDVNSIRRLLPFSTLPGIRSALEYGVMPPIREAVR